MVLGVPFFKLAPLAFKVVTKPFVDLLKRNVKKSSFWKDSVFVPLANSKLSCNVARTVLMSSGVNAVL